MKEPKRLPVLVLESGSQLFVSNSAARYLLPPESNAELVDEWLEWESFTVRPLTHIYSSLKQIDPQQVQNIMEKIFKKINQKKTKFLTSDSLTVCDLALWCTLYPIYSDETLKQVLSPFDSILTWMKNILEIPEVKDALSKYHMEDAMISYRALSIGEKYITQKINDTCVTEDQKAMTKNENLKKQKVEKPALPVSENTSPVHQAELSESELKLAEEAWVKGGKSLPKPKRDQVPILPVSGERNILITSALPYVNNVPHLGNIIGCVLSADVFARYCRLCNYNTLLICGTDEYGTATETKALEEKLTPRQICDKYFDIHNTIYRWFGIGFDYFGRTTTTEQTEIVQDIFLEVHKNGYIQTEAVEQLRCEKCEKFLADRYVEGTCPYPGCGYEDARGDQCDGCGKLINATELIKPRCKICGTSPTIKTSQQFFLDLPKVIFLSLCKYNNI